MSLFCGVSSHKRVGDFSTPTPSSNANVQNRTIAVQQQPMLNTNVEHTQHSTRPSRLSGPSGPRSSIALHQPRHSHGAPPHPQQQNSQEKHPPYTFPGTTHSTQASPSSTFSHGPSSLYDEAFNVCAQHAGAAGQQETPTTPIRTPKRLNGPCDSDTSTPVALFHTPSKTTMKHEFKKTPMTTPTKVRRYQNRQTGEISEVVTNHRFTRSASPVPRLPTRHDPSNTLRVEENGKTLLVQPKSQKMALGSITYGSDQAREFGVLRKDNSFYLRVEKCDPAFKLKLNQQIERMYNFRVPTGARDQTEHWPENALYNYCQCPHPGLQRQMDEVYRHWHDSRCRTHELGPRLLALKQLQQEMGSSWYPRYDPRPRK